MKYCPRLNFPNICAAGRHLVPKGQFFPGDVRFFKDAADGWGLVSELHLWQTRPGCIPAREEQMDTSIENSAMSLGALTQQYYAIAQNLANANTAGYKRQIVTFYEMMANQVSQDEGAGGNSGAVDDYIWVDYTQGTLLSSQRKLDCAIEGKGFLTVETPEGLRYTRNGTLRFNDVGKLVDGMGNSVIGQRGPIMLPPGVSPEQILIEQDGTISSPDGQPLGKLAMVEFTNMSALSPVGDCYIMAGEDAGKQNATQSKLHQGYLESSNSNMTDELVKMLMVTKLYEANIKSINLQDEKMRQLLNAAM